LHQPVVVDTKLFVAHERFTAKFKEDSIVLHIGGQR
jgi:hypothetical protein